MNTAEPFDIEAARKSLRRRATRRAQMLDELAARAQADLQRIIPMLIERYKPRRIYQWGSLLTPARFREWSDIDIALEGLEGPLTGLKAADEAQRLTDFPVDLVELERIHPLHAQSIREHGRIIYESA